jgi:3-hydroxybutyrate dehydrogenase
MRLRGKVALVTEAARGIGGEVAATFAREGARVVIADRDRRCAEAAAAALHGAGRRVIGVAMDVTDEREVDAGIAAATEIFGRLDILVSNAGMDVASPIEMLDLAQWRRVLSVHLDGAFLTTRAALPHMYAQRGGSIVYLGSVQSKATSALCAPYVSAKHGLMGLADVVTREGARHGVRAKVLCPGLVRLPLLERPLADAAPGSLPADAAGMTTAADVAAAALGFVTAPSPAP